MRIAILVFLFPALALAQTAGTSGKMASLRLSGPLYTSTITGTSTATNGISLTSNTAATDGTDVAFRLKTTNQLNVWMLDSLLDINQANDNIYRFWSNGRLQVISQQTNNAPGFMFQAHTGGRVLFRLAGGGGEIVELAGDNGNISLFRFGNCPATNCIVNIGPNAENSPEITITKGTGGPDVKFNVKVEYASTDSSASPGNVTNNSPSGKVAVAAGASSVVVTNSLTTAASIPWAVIQTNDSTCNAVDSVTPAAGSFTINLNANCTAATTVGFIVNN